MGSENRNRIIGIIAQLFDLISLIVNLAVTASLLKVQSY